jgi:macrolide transport system ATP-binding/permease protein
MNESFLSFRSVTFYYPTSIEPVLREVTLDLPAGWTGIVGENGAGKSTLLSLAAGEFAPASGAVTIPGKVIVCEQRTDTGPAEFEEFLFAGDREALKVASLLEIGWDWPSRWETLSHGERKRVQIAIALWRDPPVLALDEPTNHLDAEAKNIIVRGLKRYRGIGLVVSHDRELLDTLCGRTVFLRSGRAVMRPGGVSAGLREEQRELTEARRMREEARREVERISREADRRRRIADSSASRVSKRHIDPKDRDARGKIDRARVTGKDAVGGKLLRQMQGRLEAAEEKLAASTVPKAVKTGVTLRDSRARSDTLFSIGPRAVPLGDGRTLELPELVMRPTDRIALTGPNGTGKSTLIRMIVNDPALAGRPILYIPQEIAENDGAMLLESVRRESPDVLGEILSGVSRLGSAPERLLASASPSPGEVRKLMFARGLLRSPALIVMDEPTNHLDLPSIMLMEEALSKVSCALLLVSHDEPFLERLVSIRWRIEKLDRNRAALRTLPAGAEGTGSPPLS